MGTSQFKPFATGAGTSVVNQATYDAATWRIDGWRSGILPHQQINKAIRQASVVAAAITQAMAETLGSDILDNGNVALLTSQFRDFLAATNGAATTSRLSLVDQGLLTRLWSIRVPGGEPVYSSAIGPVTLYSAGLYHQCVIFTSWDWYTYAVKVSDGTILWRASGGAPSYGRPQAADVNGDGQVEVFSPSHDGLIYSRTSDGTSIRWTFANLYDRKGAASTITHVPSANTLRDTARTWLAGEFLRVSGAGQGARVVFTSGAASGQKREIVTNAGGDSLGLGTLNLAVDPPVTATAFAPGDGYYIEPRYASDKYFMHAGTLVQESGVWYLYVTSFDNHVYKLNANTGALVWEFVTGENIEPYPLVVDVAGNRRCFVVSIDGKTRSLNAATGALVWETNTGQCDAFLTAADVNSDGTLELMVSSRDNRVYLLNAVTGAKIGETTDTAAWDYGDMDSSAVPVLPPGSTTPMIISGGDGGACWAFNPDMSTKWAANLAPQAINSSPVFHDVLGNGGLAVFIGDMRGTMHCVDVSSGRSIGSLYFKGGIEGVPLYADIDGDGRPELVVTTTAGYIECFRFNLGATHTSNYFPGDTVSAGKQG